MPRVSILIPAYNSESYIRSTIESVLAQTYQDFEIIICDDQSTDNTASVVRSFNDNRITFEVNSENLGAEGNWNKVLSKAGGEFIKLICSDDEIYPTCLESKLKIFDDPKYSSVGLVSCARQVVNSKGKPIMRRSYRDEGFSKGTEAITKIVRSGTNPIGEPAAGMFRADVLSKVGKYRAIAPYAIDVDFWVRILAVKDLYAINQPLATFRISNSSWSAEIGARQFKEFSCFLATVRAENPNFVSKKDLSIGKLKAWCLMHARRAIFAIKA